MKAVFVVFDRLTSLDFVGFYDPVTRLKSMGILDDFDWRICSTARSVVDDRGLRIEAAAIGEPLKVSVCTGALLLGAAGFLQGRRATTHPSAYQELEPYCGEVVRERVVDEGDVVTAGGVSASIDLGLHLVQRLAGADARRRIAAQMDYPYRP